MAIVNGQVSSDPYPTGGQILGAQIGAVTNYDLPPSQQGADWNTQWNQTWNHFWNLGYNRTPTSFGNDSFTSARQQGYNAGLARFQNDNPTRGTTTTPPSTSIPPSPTPSSSTPIDITGQLNDIYNPTMSSLQQTEDYLRNSELPTTLSRLDTQKANLLGQVDLSEKQGLAGIDQQKNYLSQNQESAYQSALRAYQSLNQQRQVRFGGGSSAGGAVGEIARQEYFRQQGQNSQSYTNAINALAQKASDFTTALSQKRIDIENAIAQAKAEADQSFQKSLLSINLNRAQTETAKQQAKLDLLREAQNQSKQLENLKQTALINLDLFKQQHDYLIQKGLESAQTNLYQNPVNINPFTYPTKSITTPQQQGSTQLIGKLFNPQGDEFNTMLNPFS